MAAFPPSVSQVPGKITEKNLVDPEYVVLALTRLRLVLVER